MKFIAFRYLLVKAEEQLFDLPEDIKPVDLFLKPLNDNSDIIYYNKQYAIRIVGVDKGGMFQVGYFFKSKETHVIALTEKDIKESDIPNWERLFFVIDLTRQILVFEHKSSIATADNIRNVLLEFSSNHAGAYGYMLNIEYITDDQAFWDVISRSDKLFELGFDLKAPNFFGGLIEANALMARLNDKFNNTSAAFSLKNNQGKLTPDRIELDGYRLLADSGGGSWFLRAKIRGRNMIQTFKSEMNLRKEKLEDMATNPTFITDNIDLIIERLKPIIDSFRAIK